MTTTARHTLLARFKTQVEADQDEIEAFAGKMLTNPSVALSWGDSVFDTAARIELLKYVVTMLENSDYPLGNVCEFLEHRVMYLSRNPSRSSGQCVNMLARSELAVTANALEEVRREINR